MKILSNDTTEPCGNSGFAETLSPSGYIAAEDLRKTCGSTPLPLPEKEPPPVYPIDALGDILGNAAERMAYHVQAPPGMAGQSVLSACALVAQGHINVARGNIGTGPVSLYCLTIAESGDRKSTLDKLATKPIRTFEAARRERLEIEKYNYNAEFEAWSMQKEKILREAKKNKGEMTQIQKDALTNDLARIEEQKPHAIENCNITFEEPTAEGIWRHFQHGLPSAGLFSDEGVSFFNGHGMSTESKGRTIGLLAGIWDGKPMTRTRAAEGESGVMANRRLSTHLMIQPCVSSQVLSDPLLLGQGFLARFLVCHEESMAGNRILYGRDPNESVNNDIAITKYWDVLTKLINKDLPTKHKELMPKILRIEGDAYEAWVELYDRIEKESKSGTGKYADIKAFASKAAENAARIAAVLAWIENSEITIDHIFRVTRLTTYYLESMRLRTSNAQHDKNELAARDLLDWIKTHGNRLIANDFKKLPSAFRNAPKARGLLTRLVNMGYLHITEKNSNEKPIAWEIINHG